MYMGLDIGTSGVKAALVDGQGNIIRHHHVSYGFSNTSRGWRELSPEEVRSGARACMAAAGGGYPVKTVTVSALGEAVMLCDKSGRCLSPGITGTDIRGAGLFPDFLKKVGEKEFTEITGLNPSAIYSVSKLMWFMEHQQELYGRAAMAFTFQDFLIYTLSGIRAIDYSMASRTGLFDCNENIWSDRLLEASGIRKGLLSGPVRGGTVVGRILPEEACELNLPQNVLIVAGTHDHICNAIGCGAVKEGWCANTAGTTEGLTVVLDREKMIPGKVQRHHIACEPFVKGGLFNTVAWENTSGVLLKWFVDEFVREKGSDIKQIFSWLNEHMEPGPTGILVLPHFSGAATPHMDEQSKGAMVGLTLDTKRTDLYKAMMEGINYELALIMEALMEAGVEVGKIVSTGGSLSPQLLQIKADILGREIHTVESRQTGSLGGAMLGAVAFGEYSDLESAAACMVRPGLTYEPDRITHELYAEYMNQYRRFYPAVKSILARGNIKC